VERRFVRGAGLEGPQLMRISLGRLTSLRDQMISAAALRRVPQSGTDWEWAEKLKGQMVHLRGERDPLYLTLKELEPILRYKLRRQYGRTQAKRKHLSDEMVAAITRTAFGIVSPDRITTLRVKVGLLSALPGIGVPVASAVLAIVDPEEYGIIDVRAWLQVFGTPKKSFSDWDYAQYMTRVWTLAQELGWSAQRVDWCLWRLEPPLAPGAA
jgi:hypothetical protein